MKHLGVIVVLLSLGLAGCGQAAESSAPEPESTTAHANSETSKTHAKIQSAMSAAPMAIAGDATIVDYPQKVGQSPIHLREGTNDWTCFPDWRATPGNDPQCFDPMWMRWFDTIMVGTEPNITALGVAYMLQGGSDASNTDPTALEPPPGEEWMSSPPHIMLIVPGNLDRSQFSTDEHSGGPWIMYAGTPYEHLMVPVRGEMQSGSHRH